jgi:KaiC/GvpD/RAD55 family RecA-like ATPase
VSFVLGGVGTDGPAPVSPGTSLLVTGPPMSGKRRLALDLLADGRRRGEGSLLVTTDATNGEAAAAFDGAGPGPALRIVDAVGEGARERNGTHAVEFAGSPGDLTGLGIAMNKAFDAFDAEGVDAVRIALDSLSTMLTYLDAEQVYKFLHVLTGRISTTDNLGLFTLDTAAVDAQTVGMLKNTVDGLVRLDEEAGASVEGLDGVTG